MITSQGTPNITPRKYRKTLLTSLKKLNLFPEIGRIVPEIDDTNVREIFIYSYRLIYEVLPNNVQVLALIHVKHNFTGNLNDLKK